MKTCMRCLKAVPASEIDCSYDGTPRCLDCDPRRKALPQWDRFVREGTRWRAGDGLGVALVILGTFLGGVGVGLVLGYHFLR